jgi:hypothetical protein
MMNTSGNQSAPAAEAARSHWHPAEAAFTLSAEMKPPWTDTVAENCFEAHELRILQVACESWDRKEQAGKSILEHGLSYEDAKGMIRQRPEVMVEANARAAFVRCLDKLKLSEPDEDDRNQIWPPVLR